MMVGIQLVGLFLVPLATCVDGGKTLRRAQTVTTNSTEDGMCSHLSSFCYPEELVQECQALEAMGCIKLGASRDCPPSNIWCGVYGDVVNDTATTSTPVTGSPTTSPLVLTASPTRTSSPVTEIPSTSSPVTEIPTASPVTEIPTTSLVTEIAISSTSSPTVTPVTTPAPTIDDGSTLSPTTTPQPTSTLMPSLAPSISAPPSDEQSPVLSRRSSGIVVAPWSLISMLPIVYSVFMMMMM